MRKLPIIITIIAALLCKYSIAIVELNRTYQDTLSLKTEGNHYNTDYQSVSDTSHFNKIYYGKASFYSSNLEGTKTSNNEIFRHNKLTAASNKFKLGTWLRVTNLSNNKSIIVRVNDRMHPKMAAKGRIVDLSYLGAKKLDFLKKGLTKVQVQVVPNGTKE
ncbi:MAG: septal ring lytic transglycosylase RlpA family protein [Chitinophagaceae bacterium]